MKFWVFISSFLGILIVIGVTLAADFNPSVAEAFNSVKYSFRAAEAEKFKMLVMKTVVLEKDYSMQWIQVSK